jgi:hypothetical protein
VRTRTSTPSFSPVTTTSEGESQRLQAAIAKRREEATELEARIKALRAASEAARGEGRRAPDTKEDQAPSAGTSSASAAASTRWRYAWVWAVGGLVLVGVAVGVATVLRRRGRPFVVALSRIGADGASTSNLQVSPPAEQILLDRSGAKTVPEGHIDGHAPRIVLLGSGSARLHVPPDVSATVNDESAVGEVDLDAGDSIRIGDADDTVRFVFLGAERAEADDLPLSSAAAV